MKKLYKFYWDCGRMGSLKGLFIAEEKDVEFAMGRHIYFGEVLGKHSEIRGNLEEDEIEVVSNDQERIEWLEQLLGTNVSGYNPLNCVRIDCENCGDEIHSYGDWYDHKIIDGDYYCDTYNEETQKCEW